MKRVMIFYFSILAVGASCQSGFKTNKELFDQQYETNVKTCTDALVRNTGLDSLEAETICSCMLNNLFVIDSNFVRMPVDSLDLLLEKNRKILEEMCKKQEQ
ncbi:hypothetical protein [uncultured Bacteroides sp.]|uniref:hypothetical protein n=1 Tax=uncultured Bacteroides sp. TaxID=162156 RepID=UPI0025D0A181|nr:hypothetical protein [uncultured Bacteroides sp.]